MLSPVDSAARLLMPISTPTVWPVGAYGSISTSVQHMDTKYLPLGAWLTVALITCHFLCGFGLTAAFCSFYEYGAGAFKPLGKRLV